MNFTPFLGLLFVLFTLIIFGLIHLYLTWNFNYWKKLGVKGPAPVLVYGSVSSIVTRNRNMVFDLQDLYEKYKNIGDTFIGIFMTRNPNILILDPKLANDIMVTKFKAFRDNESSTWINRKVEEVSRRNPFLTYFGLDWRQKRTEFIGGLTPTKLKSAFAITMAMCKKMTKFVRTTLDKSGNNIEIQSLCYKLTMDITADFVWGIDAKSFQPEFSSSNRILQMSENMLKGSFHRVGLYYLYGLFPLIRKLINDCFYPKETDEFFTNLQKEAVILRDQSKTSRQDYLNHLIHLREKNNISNLDMVGHSLTVLLDSFDTAGLVIYHALIYLANNQISQEKLRKEIMESLEEGQLTYETLSNLPYLDQCLNETIRLIAPIATISRMCTERTFLEARDGKFVQINPGMIVHIPVFAYHHDKDIFPEPEEFIPERFDDGKAKHFIQNGYFVPFGAGPRICAGMKLGQLECKAGIFEIIKNFQINVSKTKTYTKYINTNGTAIGLPNDTLLEFKAL